jgi:hypothetical protein
MSTVTVSPLRRRMIEDMNARKLCAETQWGHIHSCRRFAAFLKQSPDTATAEDIRRFQLHLSETGVFLLRVTLRRLDLAAEIYHIREPQKIPLVLRYLSRYTHRVAISNRRLIAADDGGVSFRWKDYRIEGPGGWKNMTLKPHEFIRRFLMHVLPHRIRHYGLLASGNRAANIAKARELLAVPAPNSPIHPRLRRPTNNACCRVRAPAAVDAFSSSRPSRADVSPSIVPQVRRQRS